MASGRMWVRTDQARSTARNEAAHRKADAMAGVKMVALAKQLALGVAESIENAVGDVKQPGAKREKHRLDKRKMKMHGADEEPRPERGDGRRIQAEQMPPFRQVVEASCQVSVYVGPDFGFVFATNHGRQP